MDPGFVNHLGGGSPFDRAEMAIAFEAERSDEELEILRSFRADEDVFDYLLRRGEGGR